MADNLTDGDIYYTDDEDDVVIELSAEERAGIILVGSFMLMSLCTIGVLTCVKKRKNLCLDFLNGHIALVVPINFLEERHKRKAFVAAFALITLAVVESSDFKVIFGNVGPYLKLPVRLLIVTFLSLMFFTLLSCIHSRTLFSCSLGLLYMSVLLAHHIFDIYLSTQTELVLEEKMDKVFLQSLIVAVACLFLIFWFIKQIYKILKYGKSEKKVINKYQIKYVKSMLQSKNKFLIEINLTTTKLSKFRKFFGKYIYSTVPGFRYSLSILISCTVGFIMISKFGLKLIFKFSKRLSHVQTIMEKYKDLKNFTLPNVVKSVVNMLYHSDTSDPDEINMYDFINSQATLIYVAIVLAITFALVLNILTICHELKSYRDNVINLARRKQEQNIMNIKNTNNVNLVLSAIHFSGYQVSFFFFGFTMQMIFLGVLFLVVGELTVLPMQFAMKGFFKWIASLIVPFLIVVVVTKVSQFLLVKYVFLEDKGKTMALTNRRGFSIMVYIVFFYNVLSGFMSCLLRIAKGVIMGLFLLPRLDRSVFPRTFENKDSAFKSYTCLLRLEALQTSPILVCFVYILNKTYRESEMKEKLMNDVNLKLYRKINKKAQIRWFVAYTLVCNPVLVYERKLYLLKNPRSAQAKDEFFETINV